MNAILNRFDRLMMAITFAEADAPELTLESPDTRNLASGKRSQQTIKMTGVQIAPNQTAH